MKRTIITVIVLANAVSAYGVTELGGAPGAYLELGSGARPIAINAYTAIADDPSAIFYNPGGLDLISGTKLYVTYNQPYSEVDDVTSAGVAFVNSLSGVGFSLGAVGLGINYYKTGGLYTANDHGLTGEQFSDYELEAVLGWGKGFGGSLATGADPNLYFGLAMKMYQSKIYDYTDKGFGMDLGTIIRPIKPLKISLVAENAVAPNMQLKSARETYPFKTDVGVSYDIMKMAVVSAEGRVRDDGDYEVAVGGEFNIKDMAFIRGGYEAVYSRYAFGAGFKYKEFIADFTYKPHEDLGASYIASVGLSL